MDRRTLRQKLDSLPPADECRLKHRGERCWRLADVLAHLQRLARGLSQDDPVLLRAALPHTEKRLTALFTAILCDMSHAMRYACSMDTRLLEHLSVRTRPGTQRKLRLLAALREQRVPVRRSPSRREEMLSLAERLTRGVAAALRRRAS